MRRENIGPTSGQWRGTFPPRRRGKGPISFAAEWATVCATMTKKISNQKMEVRGAGVGLVSPEDIERRARELALIENRTTPDDSDRTRARSEFQDRNLPAAVNEDADSTQSLSRDPSDPLADRGRQVPEYGPEDEKAALERLALEGVEEAQHDQMVESRNFVDEPLRSRPKRRQT
jgi:hypothetical protein